MNARVLLAFPCLLLSVLAGCGNPALDVKIDDYKDDGLTPGPLHRPGQPCVDCHGPYKGASPEFVIAGTVFGRAVDKDPVPVRGAKVTVYGTLEPERAITATTNCNGNFMIKAEDIQKAIGHDTVGFPLRVSITCPGSSTSLEMQGKISREGSCGACHQGAPSPTSPGFVTCNQDYAPPTRADCSGAFRP